MPNRLDYSRLASLALLTLSPALMGATVARVEFKQRLLLSHNQVRAQAGVAPLEWSDDLARDAAVWANELAATGRFEHSPDEPGQDPEGENLWAGTPGAFSPEAMVQRWASERRDYRPGVFPNNSVSGDVENVGHYTQLIWSRTGQVGCALRRGVQEEFLVCRYSQAGNVYGERPV